MPDAVYLAFLQVDVDPLVGGGFSRVASYLVLIATLFVRPYGLFGRPDIERV
jgi:branched-chain amino acid transport system permease protein